MARKKLAILGVIIIAVAVFVGAYLLYWAHHPYISISAATGYLTEADYHNERVMVATWGHRGIPAASRVEKELMRMTDWNNQVADELYAYTAPYYIQVSGENENGKVTLRYQGYVTDQNGRTVDYEREATFDLFVRDEDFKLPKDTGTVPLPYNEDGGESAAREKADVTFEDEQNGTASQRVTVGENAAVIKVSFSYELQGDRRVITDIGSAVAENLSGWYRVDRAATVSEDEIVLVKDGGKASVPVTYQASIGAGSESYDAVVVIDLTAD